MTCVRRAALAAALLGVAFARHAAGAGRNGTDGDRALGSKRSFEQLGEISGGGSFDEGKGKPTLRDEDNGASPKKYLKTRALGHRSADVNSEALLLRTDEFLGHGRSEPEMISSATFGYSDALKYLDSSGSEDNGAEASDADPDQGSEAYSEVVFGGSFEEEYPEVDSFGEDSKDSKDYSGEFSEEGPEDDPEDDLLASEYEEDPEDGAEQKFEEDSEEDSGEDIEKGFRREPRDVDGDFGF